MEKSSLSLTLALSLALAGCMGSAPEIGIRQVGPATGAADDMALSKAQMFFARGEYALAIEAFRKAIRYAPKDPVGYNGLAASYDRIGRPDLSGRYFELALALAPREPKLFENFAHSLERQGKTAEADAVREEARALQAMPAAGTAATAVIVPEAVRGRSATVALDPPAGREAVPARPAPATRMQLVRLSLAEVALVTRVTIPAVATAPATPIEAARKPVAALRIVNAVGRRGQAARMRTYLAGLGWTDAATGDASVRLTQSRLLAPAGRRDEALRLAGKLPFRAPVVRSARADRIVLVLGTNATRFDDRLRIARN